MSARERLVFGLLLGGLACSAGALRVDPPPVNPAMVPPISAKAPVAVRGVARGKAPYALGIGSGATVDDDAITEALVASVAGALGALGVDVAEGAERRVELAVTRVSARLGGVHYVCTVDFNRRLGNGELAGLQGRGVDVDFRKACSQGVKEAATTAVGDGAVQRYLEAP